MKRDPTLTEIWLAQWLNENGSFVACNDPLNVPLLGSFLLPALSEAIDNREKLTRSQNDGRSAA